MLVVAAAEIERETELSLHQVEPLEQFFGGETVEIIGLGESRRCAIAAQPPQAAVEGAVLVHRHRPKG